MNRIDNYAWGALLVLLGVAVVVMLMTSGLL